MTELTYDAEHEIILVTSSELPHDEDFELWATLFLHAPAITTADFDAGADRHQLRFHFTDHSFNLNFEHYSESIWINAEGIEASAALPQLHQYLVAQLQ
ncbi:DUF3630 family protein [Pseudoalteromonas sp. D15MCD-2]|jgi:hypothetical protein|uniref:DUF3630 family protein n=1 Tax=Pseudoalteromonas TaxID=53246 RepID=UPI0006D68CAA|nr:MULTISPECIES: DUF3630 family protein [Pseudoalteromonas]KPZ68823.1 hypothetical protein AN394_03011 [Pseudoalteromonas sp. P1-26]KZY44472.1 hypothetical protein A3733_03135 [Pseudoalteromonas shioyasakiensis]MAB62017.1 DUF3630 domain-containing protein [Pseudoalteromonas sp.]MCG9733912.1 DUF3630 family protein [Pseudoalteromonas shioyasakiensis]MDI4653823.1 DUF3630 family protein [Pseudoalteromonas shioyasakiensis]|tara:strand:- start:2658 stop:2954 length:297 start_codon:yes stop_codon:yes gene_type:complete